MDNDIFIKAVLVDKVKLKPRALCKNKSVLFQDMLAQRFEGVCTYHGYIKKGSISIVRYTAGLVKDVFLNGDVEYHVTYNALVCNPAIGSTVRAKVINQNMFGILGEVSVMCNGQTVPVLEVIITKMTDVDDDAKVSFDDIAINDMINVEILKKKFELGDTKILNVGRIIKNDIEKHELDGGGSNSDDDELNELNALDLTTLGGGDVDPDADADADPDADEEDEKADRSDDEKEESVSGSASADEKDDDDEEDDFGFGSDADDDDGDGSSVGGESDGGDGGGDGGDGGFEL